MGLTNIYYFKQYTIMIQQHRVYILGVPDELYNLLSISSDIIAVLPHYLKNFPAEQHGHVIQSYLSVCITEGNQPQGIEL